MFTVEVRAKSGNLAPHGQDWIRSDREFETKNKASEYASFLFGLADVDLRVVEIEETEQ